MMKREKRSFKKWARILASLLAVILVFQSPLSYTAVYADTEGETAPGDAGNPPPSGTPAAEIALAPGAAAMQEAAPASETTSTPTLAPRAPMDWTSKADAFKLALQKIIYSEKDKEQVIVKNDNLICNVSAIDPDALESFGMEFTFDFLKASEENALHAGDIFTLAIPEAQFKVADTSAPVDLKTCDKAQYLADSSAASDGGTVVGTYEIQGQTLKATFGETVTALEGQEVFGSIPVSAQINKEALSGTEKATADITVQTGSTTSVVLPMMPAEAPDPTPTAAPTETPETPSQTPTAAPTEAPEAPDPTPTEAPTETPETPSQTPTAAPTEAPEAPDPTPTAAPTETPEAPSPTPTAAPTETPADQENTNDKDKGQDGEKTDKEELAEQVRKLFRSTDMPVRGITKDIDEEYFGGATVTKKKFTKDGDALPKGFETVKLTVLSKKGGYSKDAPEKQYVGMSYEMYMDEVFLLGKSDEFLEAPGFPVQGVDQSDEDWKKAIAAWMKDQDAATVPPLVYTYDLGEEFRSYNSEKIDISSADDKDFMVGSYKAEGGILTVTMNPLLYFMSNISFEFSFNAEIDASKWGDKSQEVVIGDEGGLVFQPVGTSGGGSDTPAPSKYKVEKEAPAKVTDTSIEYHLTVEAQEGENLNGMTLVDAMPTGLKVNSFTMTKKNGENTAVKIEVPSATEAKYTFEELDTDAPPANKIISAKFTLAAELTDEVYGSELVKNGKINKDFTNQAKLLKAGETEPVVVSNETSTTMSVTFINKKGQSSNLEGTKYAWTINLDTKLPTMDYGYLVDSIRWTDHTYDFETGITITTEGSGSETITKAQIKEYADGSTPWRELTAANIKGMADAALTEGCRAFYYLYNEEDVANPFYAKGNDEPEKVQRAVLVIPYNGYQGTTESRAVTIKYYTDLNTHGLHSKEYTDIINDVDKNYKQSIDNDVNLLWKNIAGSGPEPVPQDEVKFGKDVTSDLGTVNKRGVAYDPATRTVKWSVDVNKLGVGLTDVVLTDVLGKGAYDIGSLEIQGLKKDTSTQTQTNVSLKKVDDISGKIPLTYMINNEASGNGVLTIYLGDMEPNKVDPTKYVYYTLTFAMKLTDSALLSTQSKDQQADNSIKLEAKYGGEPYGEASTGHQTIPNTLIEKDSVGTYDYQTHKFQWAVTVNPEHVNLTAATVTDTIETGFSFGELQKVEVEGTEDTTELDRLKGMNAAGQTIAWDLGAIGTKSYKLYFTTEASEDWRSANLKCVTDANGGMANPSVTVPNKVALTGTVVEGGVSHAISKATDSASNTVEKKPLTKKGTLNKETGRISWEVLLNQGQYDLSGLSLVENLNNTGTTKGVHELAVDSVKVYTMDADGTKPVEITDATLSTVDANGFTYTFPTIAGGNFNTYKITFETDLTEGAAKPTAKINNQVYLDDGKGGSSTETSKPDNGGFNGGFDFDNAAKANSRPKIALRKISSNSTDQGGDKNQSLGLNAEFALNGYGYTYNSESGVLSVDSTKPIAKYDKTRVVEEGDAKFLNINPKDDLVYVLQENTPEAGYLGNTAKPVFLYFPTENTGTSKVGAVTKILYSSIGYGTEQYERIDQGDYGAAKPIKTVTVKNTPVASTFTFTKKQVKLSTYSDIDGTLNCDYEAAQNVVFKVEPQGSLAGKVNTQYITTGSEGKATITNLDPGTYKLTEVKSNSYMSIGGTVTLTVTWNATNKQYEYSLSNAGGGMALDNTAANTLNDDVLKGDFSFTKYVQYKDGAMPADANREVLGGVSFKIEGTTQGGSGTNYSKTVKSDPDGTVTFRDLPVGSYTVSETVPAGYSAIADNGKVYKVTVTEKETDDVIGKEGTTEYKNKIAEVTATLVVITVGTPGEGTSTTINNTAIKGSIFFTKVLDASGMDTLDRTAPIAGAEFGLFRKIGNTTATTATYVATSGIGGEVTFAGVEYSDYILKETKVPAGCVATLPTEGITITKANLAKGFDDSASTTTFTYNFSQNSLKKDGKVTNGLYKTSAGLTKTDEDGGKLPGVSFDVFRRGNNVVAEDGAGFALDVAAGITDYWRYKTLTVESDNGGDFALNDIPYGDYLLVEDNSLTDLQEGQQNTAIYVSVRNDAVTVKDTGNFAGTLKDGTHYENVEAADWSKVTAPTAGGRYRIINMKKYAYVNVNKCTAERTYNADGTLGVLKPGGRALAGAEFEILKDGKHYLTLQTDAEGKLAGLAASGEHAGAYQDFGTGTYKHLFYGSYTIKETKAPSGFKTNGTEVVFELSETNTGHEGTAWISLNDSTASASYTKKDVGMPGGLITANELLRGGFSLNKTDESSDPQDGATFIVYVGEKPVASLEGSTKGKYILTNENPEGGVYDEKNGAGDPYIYGTKGHYRLLPGTYAVKETKAPDGYETTEFTLKLTANTAQTGVDISVDGNPAASYDAGTNVVSLKETPIALSLEKQDLAGKKLKGAVFSVEGEFADVPTTAKEIKNLDENMAAANAAGFIGGNVYILKETTAPVGYCRYTEEVTFKVHNNGTVEITDPTADSPVTVSTADKSKMIFKDTPFEVTLKKADAGDADVVIGDVTFTLTDVTNTPPVLVGTFKTGSVLGTVKLTGLTVNHKYSLKETSTTKDYIMRADEITFTVKDDGTLEGLEAGKGSFEAQTLTVTNEKVNASVKVKKMDLTSGAVLGGVTFNLQREGDTAGAIAKATSKEGIVEWTGLSKGKYTLTETGTYANYCPDTADLFSCTFEITDECGSNAQLDINSNASAEFNLQKTSGTWKTDGVTNKRKPGTVTLQKQGQDEAGTQTPLSGAKFGLYYADGTAAKIDGNDVWAITDIDGKLSITDLPWAKYYLKEIEAPAGYEQDETPLTFEIKAGQLNYGFSVMGDSGHDVINKVTTLTISKRAAENANQGLQGAKFTIAGVFAGNGSMQTREFDMTAAETTTICKQLIAGNSYTLTETKAPDGYQITSPIAFTVRKDGQILIGENTAPEADRIIVVKDQPIEVDLIKKSADGDTVLTGGIYEVTPADGQTFLGGSKDPIQVTDTKDSMKDALAGRLMRGSAYVLTERKAPKGYELAKPVTFALDGDGRITITAGGDIASVSPTDTSLVELTLKDTPIEAVINKRGEGAAPGILLDGAEFTVTPVSGSKFAMAGEEAEPPKEITVTKNNSDELTARLIAGNKYTITEKTEPSGYIKLTEVITVEVKADGTLTLVPDPDVENSAAVLESGNTAVLITDQPTRLFLNKANSSPTGQKLAGATLEIRDEKGQSLNPKRE